MKSLKCSKICDHGCPFVARADSERRVVQLMMFHGENYHRELFIDLTDMHRQHINRKMHAMVQEE